MIGNLSKNSAETLMKLITLTSINPGADDALDIMTRIHIAKIELQHIINPDGDGISPEQAEAMAKELVAQRDDVKAVADKMTGKKTV